MSAAWRVSGYSEIRELGTGASGSVVLADHNATGRPVAIKYLSDRLAGDPDFLAGFRAEARLLTEIDDPNIARLYEYVQSDGHAAMVLELVDGVTLRRLLTEHAPLTPEAALVVLKGSLLGLAAAHERGVVHRDYKPDNVMVTGTGATKLIDFGVAVRSGRDAPSAGTPDYMAPEQWAGASATPATDVYAATCVFVECLTGRRPFPADSPDALRRQHLNAPPPLDDVPAPVRRLVADGLAKQPQRRPATARAFLAELERAATEGYGADWAERGRRDLGRLALLLAAFFPLGSAVGGGLAALALTVLGRRRLIAGAAVVAAVLVGGAAAATTTGTDRHPTTADGPILATVTVGPPVTGPAPSLSAPPSGSVSASPRASHTRPPRVTTTPPPVHTTPVHTASAPSTHPPRPPHSSTLPPPPTPLIVNIVKNSVTQIDNSTDGAIYVNLSATDGRPVVVTLTYNDGSSSQFTESGHDSYTITQTHAFPACGTTWSFTVSTDPVATTAPPPATTDSTC